MKRLLIFLLAVIGSMNTVSAGEANFGAEPYEMGKGILGIEGWQARLAGDESRTIAQVVKVRWDDDKPALMLKGASLKNVEIKIPHDQDRMTFSCQLAFNFTSRKAADRPLRLHIGAAPFNEIYLDRSETGGLGFGGDGGGRKGGTLMLPREEIKLNSFYQLSAVIDYANGTYTIELTGTKRDGTPLQYRSEEVAFEVTPALRNSMGQINYFISAPVMTVYVRDLKIE